MPADDMQQFDDRLNARAEALDALAEALVFFFEQLRECLAILIDQIKAFYEQWQRAYLQQRLMARGIPCFLARLIARYCPRRWLPQLPLPP